MRTETGASSNGTMCPWGAVAKRSGAPRATISIQDAAKFVRAADQHLSPGGHQFLARSVAVENARRSHSVVSRADHIVASIPNHDRCTRLARGLPQRPSQQIGLSRTVALQRRTEKTFEPSVQTEVFHDALRVDLGLAGGDEERNAPAGKPSQRLGYAVVKTVLIHADIGESLPIVLQRDGGRRNRHLAST